MKSSAVFDRLTITQIIAIWLFGVILFGALYFGLILTNQPLTHDGKPLTNDVIGFGNSIYFSFITALTIGYNDITPSGLAKLVVIIEAIFSITMLGIFIARIVAVKQEELVQEVEELSFEESTNSAISELYIFRSEIKTIQESMKTGKKAGSDVRAFENTLPNLRLALLTLDQSTGKLTSEQKENSSLRVELIINSINFSLSRMVELTEAFSHRKADWKKESTTATIAECARITQKLYDQYSILRSNEHQGTKIAEKLNDLNTTLNTLKESSK
jgi:hypothetical protein